MKHLAWTIAALLSALFFLAFAPEAEMVGAGGLEPPKHYAADLQSAPFAARDTLPRYAPLYQE